VIHFLLFFLDKNFVFFLISNGTCVHSEKGQIVSDTKSNRVLVQWGTKQGNSYIHFLILYNLFL
jgi:hypothetical protein